LDANDVGVETVEERLQIPSLVPVKVAIAV
jgi:hypothetical protein